MVKPGTKNIFFVVEDFEGALVDRKRLIISFLLLKMYKHDGKD